MTPPSSAGSPRFRVPSASSFAALAVAFALLSGAGARAQEGRPVSPDEPLLPAPPPQDATRPAADRVETHRIRIVNRRDGAIQVSTDQGRTYRLIGRVLVPATSVTEGYLAARYAAPGTMAATAVHGLRIRTGGSDPNGRPPLVLCIEPSQYATERAMAGYTPNKGFGGYVAGASGIFTDIPAGASIFRELAPVVGNPVFLESNSGRLFPLPVAFRPAGQGEAVVLVALAPRNSLAEVRFQNRAGGAVEATWADGTTKQISAVVRPVRGVGRFDGTTYTGAGRINTAHTGVITVSTAPIDALLPEGQGKERRGGFQISPAWHNSLTEEAGSPVVLTVGTPKPYRREMEGQPPLFRDAIGLDDEDATVEVSIDDGPWEPMPIVTGFRPQAFAPGGLNQIWKERGVRRTCARGVTAFRLRLPKREPERMAQAARAAAQSYTSRRLAAAKAGKMAIVRGQLTINANPTKAEGVALVRFSVEGDPRGFTNVAPFALTWDTTRVPDGEYLVEAEAMDAGGAVLATTRRRVFVLNNPQQTSAQVSPAPK